MAKQSDVGPSSSPLGFNYPHDWFAHLRIHRLSQDTATLAALWLVQYLDGKSLVAVGDILDRLQQLHTRAVW